MFSLLIFISKNCLIMNELTCLVVYNTLIHDQSKFNDCIVKRAKTLFVRSESSHMFNQTEKVINFAQIAILSSRYCFLCNLITLSFIKLTNYHVILNRFYRFFSFFCYLCRNVLSSFTREYV